MELLRYWRIIRRSWTWVVGLPLLVGLLSLGLTLVQARPYSAHFAMLVTQRPLAPTQETVVLPDYNNLQSWLASEYINDDLVELVQTQRFAQDIAGWIQQQHGVALDPRDITAALSAERRHRMVYLDVVARDPQHPIWIGQGAIGMLQQHGLNYWGRGDTTQLNVAVVEQPSEATQFGGLLSRLSNVLVLVSLAALLGLCIAFLRHRIGQHIHERADIETLGLDVIGMIPRDSRR